MSAGRFAGFVAALVVWMSVAASAEAQSQCKVDTDCAKGLICQVTATSACAGAATPAAAPLPPADCDAGNCGAKRPAPAEPPPVIVPCTPEEYRSCVPGPCMSDSDCGDGLVCHERRRGSCTTSATPACEPGFKCPDVAPAPPVCTETVDHICVPRYLLPCEQATQCGAGFTCEAQSRCGCGSAGTDQGGAGGAGASPPAAMRPAAQDAGVPADGDASVPDPAAADRALIAPPACKCEPTTEKYCKVIETACKLDSDCPNLWTCKPSATGTASAGPCFVPADGGAMTCAPAQPTPPVYRCEPPYQSIDVDSVSSGRKYEDLPVMMPNTSPTTPTTNPPPPAGKPTVGGTPGQTTGGPGTANPQAPEAAPVPTEGPHHVKSCAVATPGASGGHLAIWVALVALAVVERVRRRNRRA